MTRPTPTSTGSSRDPATIAAASLAVTAACAAALGQAGAGSRRLVRTNFHGRTVSLRGGVGVAVGSVAVGACAGRLLYDAGAPAGANPALAAMTVAAAAGAVGLIDDLDAGAHDGDAPAKGLKGHLTALRRGHVTTGALKVVGIGAGALVAGGLITRGRPQAGALRAAADAATNAVVIASWANLHNLLDLRPGRALKAAVLTAAPLLADRRSSAAASRALAAGTLGVAGAALPADLGETTMLGDTGANALGALVGTALAANPRVGVRAAAALAGTGLVLASERVSFTRLIEGNRFLSAIDRCGRRAS